MKIGITCYPSVGGSGIIATELGLKLAEQGNEIHFITSSLPFRLDNIQPQIYFHEVEPSHYPVFKYPPYDLALASKMAEVIDREKLDVIHVHYAMPHAVCAILAKDIAERDVKIVTTLHGTDITVLGIDTTFKPMIRYAIENSDAVTAVSKDLAQQTYDVLNIDKEIEVIYNFVNEQDYYREKSTLTKSDYDISENEKVIIHISNFRKVKRIEDVVLTFDKVRERTDAKLLLIGDGPELNTAVQLVEKLHLTEHVLFLGKQKNISDLLYISDLMLLLSEKESFGLVLLEAMICEVPCIGTNVGGIPEVINHGQTGYTVDIGDTNQAANYAVHLLTNDNLATTFTKNALEYANKYFHSEVVVSQYMNLYNRLLTTPRDNGGQYVQ